MANAPVKIYVKGVEYIGKHALVENLKKAVNKMHELFLDEDLKEFDANVLPVIRMIEKL